MKYLAILGSTGSIGRQCLSVVDALAPRFGVVALAAGGNLDELIGQIERYQPELVSVADEKKADALSSRLREKGIDKLPAIHHGAVGMLAVATHSQAEIVVSAAVGVVGLPATYEAVKLGKTVALSNKEVLVAAGELVMTAAHEAGKELLPVDSEHNAVHQCLHGRPRAELKRLVLTASGGPFLGRSAASLAGVTAAAALKHPTWRMGRKITIDSATLMNKGLEVIEARWLFDVPAAQIDIVVHPQSVVHSMIELADGSIIAQLGVTDMRLPIQYAFSYPERWPAPLPSLDLTTAGPLEFAAPDADAFPCLRLAYRALEAERSLPVVLNAANEIAVARFLEGRLAFTAIAQVIERTMDAHRAGRPEGVQTLAEVRTLDRWAREHALDLARRVELKV